MQFLILVIVTKCLSNERCDFWKKIQLYPFFAFQWFLGERTLALDSLQWLRGEFADLGQVSQYLLLFQLTVHFVQARVHPVVRQPVRLPSLQVGSAGHHLKEAD